MKLSKDEIIKKLALGIVRNIHIHAKRYQCHFCKVYDREHSSDCPVLLAEEVLKEIEKCNICSTKTDNMCGLECHNKE